MVKRIFCFIMISLIPFVLLWAGGQQEAQPPQVEEFGEPITLSRGLKMPATSSSIAWNLKPKAGITRRNYIIMANKTPHPNSARLLIRWLIGDELGGAGFKPWFVPGQWPSRSDVKPPETDVRLDEPGKISWYIDYQYVNEQGLE